MLINGKTKLFTEDANTAFYLDKHIKKVGMNTYSIICTKLAPNDNRAFLVVDFKEINLIKLSDGPAQASTDSYLCHFVDVNQLFGVDTRQSQALSL
jgi:hypothetical protein